MTMKKARPPERRESVRLPRAGGKNIDGFCFFSGPIQHIPSLMHFCISRATDDDDNVQSMHYSWIANRSYQIWTCHVKRRERKIVKQWPGRMICLWNESGLTVQHKTSSHGTTWTCKSGYKYCIKMAIFKNVEIWTTTYCRYLMIISWAFVATDRRIKRRSESGSFLDRLLG